MMTPIGLADGDTDNFFYYYPFPITQNYSSLYSTKKILSFLRISVPLNFENTRIIVLQTTISVRRYLSYNKVSITKVLWPNFRRRALSCHLPVYFLHLLVLKVVYMSFHVHINCQWTKYRIMIRFRNLKCTIFDTFKNNYLDKTITYIRYIILQ